MTLQMPLENLSLEELRDLETQKQIEVADLFSTEETIKKRRLAAESEINRLEYEIMRRLDN